MATIKFNDQALARLLTSTDGPVARDLARRAINVESQAKLLCTVDGGRLRTSITWEVGQDSRGLYARIGSNVEYARYVEEGTPPRVIVPVRKQALFWKGASHPVRRVNHPGTRARPYLRPALPAAAF